MRLNVWLCVVVAAVLDVMAAAVDHVEPRNVRNNRRDEESPLLPEDRLTRLRNHYSSDTRGRQWTGQNTYSRHYTQEGLDTRATFGVNQRLRGRYHSPRGRVETRNLHAVTATRHEPRALQPARVDHTGFPIVRDSARDPSSISRATTTEGERFSSHVHQVGLHTTNDSRRLPYTPESYQTRISPASRDRLQRPPPQQNVEINITVSHDDATMDSTAPVEERGEQVHSASLATSGRSEERPAHRRHMAPTTRSHSSFQRYPSTVITRGLPRDLDAARERPRTRHGFSEVNEVENLQRLDHPDQCCGSRVPFDPRTGRPTGAFQRVASAGSIKVVNVPARSSFPPSEVRDLWAAPLDPHTLSLTWTAPGGDLDSGTASGYIIRLSEARHDLQESQFDAAPEETLLEASETLTAAGVYQTAGTRVGVEMPLVRQLQRGHVYYVALKALDNDGYSSGVSNVAQFTIPGSSTANNAADSLAGPHTQAEEAPGTPDSRGFTRPNGEGAVFSERVPGALLPLPRDSNTASEKGEPNEGGNSEEQSLLSNQPTSIPEPNESEASKNQRKRRKDRKKKKNKKSKRGRKDGRRNGRRGGRQRGGNSDTFAHDPEECEPQLSLPSQPKPVSLCQAHHSLALAITYLTQNNEYQYLDYLSAALHTLEQKMQPSWRRETDPPRVRRSEGRRGISESLKPSYLGDTHDAIFKI